MDQSEDLERKRMPWARFGFDLEGLVGAVAAWLLGVLLGLLWDPLIWIGVIAAVIILAATRYSKRTAPPRMDAIVSPVDGVLVSIEELDPPAELRLGGGLFTRLRISSSPASMNRIHSPMAGEVSSLIEEAGEQSVVVASQPDMSGLEQSFLTLRSGSERVGIRVACAAFGPRMEIDVEMGDPVRLGRKIGVRRLGGWCDVWLNPAYTLAVWPGMSLRAGETELVGQRAASDWGSAQTPRGQAEAPEEPEADEPFVIPEATVEDEDEVSDDPAEMFARLRAKVNERRKDDKDDETS